jgi:hypothetical protein
MGLISFNVQLPKMGAFSGIGSKITSGLGSFDLSSKIEGMSGGFVDKLTSQVTSQMEGLDMSSISMPEFDMSELQSASSVDINGEINNIIADINSGNF